MYIIPEGGHYFRFLTNLSWMGISLYMFIASFVGIYSLWTGASAAAESIPQWAITGVEILFTLSYSLSWIVSIIFWTLLTGMFKNVTDPLLLFTLVNAHSANFLIMQAELWSNRLPVRGHRVFLLFATLYAYAAYTYTLFYAFGVPWPYPFFEALDFKANAFVALIGIVIFTALYALFFGMAWGLARLRDRVMDRYAAGGVDAAAVWPADAERGLDLDSNGDPYAGHAMREVKTAKPAGAVHV
ncbi:hypothetical protein BC831DRAFT_295381 [Entophlyctis helioformis]|nr:hypothetical protein BC831DRAFT_295381 [Entophlyctis helioformis]